MRGSIRRRLVAGTAIGVSLTFAISGLIIYTVFRAQLHAQFDDNLADQARTLSALVEQQSATSIESDLDRAELAGEYYELWGPAGVFRRSVSLGTHDLGRPRATGMAFDRVTLPDGRDGRQATYAFSPAPSLEDGPTGPPLALTLAVARPTDPIDDTIARLARVLILVGLAATLGCVLLLTAIVRFGLRPVRELAAAIAELREENLEARLDAARTPAELHPVVERLNDLLQRLAAAFARERELTAEVAHELRTPMAGLRATLEVALDRERSPERYRTSLADCLAIVVQTERMVTSLLSLARLDAGTATSRSASVALDALVRDTIAPHAARATERGLTIETDLLPVTLSTDREQLGVVIGNLVDNAVTYANPGGTIEIALTGSQITVANTGCTLTSDQVSHVFDRFWRADGARSGTNAGLGLALSKKLVELVGGHIAAEVKDGQFVVTLSLQV